MLVNKLAFPQGAVSAIARDRIAATRGNELEEMT
jgi:hypothetical protein